VVCADGLVVHVAVGLYRVDQVVQVLVRDRARVRSWLGIGLGLGLGLGLRLGLGLAWGSV